METPLNEKATSTKRAYALRKTAAKKIRKSKINNNIRDKQDG
jgi:hypothetical protein